MDSASSSIRCVEREREEESDAWAGKEALGAYLRCFFGGLRRKEALGAYLRCFFGGLLAVLLWGLAAKKRWGLTCGASLGAYAGGASFGAYGPGLLDLEQ